MNSDSSLSVNYGSTFWDWVTGPHDRMKRIFILIGFVVVIVLLWKFTSWVVPVFLILSIFVGWMIFRNAFFNDDSVRVIALDPEDPTFVSYMMVGNHLFSELSSSGIPQMMHDSKHHPVYIAEEFSSSSIRFSWIHETSRWIFITKSEAFDLVRATADAALYDLELVKNIPRTLAVKEASAAIRHYDKSIDDLMSGTINEDDLLERISKLQNRIADLESHLREVRS